MRFILKLKNIPGERILPINYQYELASWIYSVLAQGDKNYAKNLHSKKESAYKLFTFSKLKTPEVQVYEDRLILFSEYSSFEISFLEEKTGKTFLIGLFSQKEFSIGDKKSRATFNIEKLEEKPKPNFTDTMRFYTLSPICISKPGSNGFPDYLGPEDENYESYFLKHLIHKYESYLSKDTKEELSETLQLKVLDKPVRKLIKLKASSENVQSVRVYQFAFEIKANAEINRMAYYAGFGEKNSMGFGCVEVKKEISS
ncbi:MAG: CRISPR-associated endoribonuclease Cas6 [Leptospiraceae bacterium]|nr:CRISPR-associated endoribonuclease Cas6 [Leptospiraceae bacterium]MCP5503233.1 CRISPR-associated endoribonuclease Cas6 [Leptospiraceae bacterium]